MIRFVSLFSSFAFKSTQAQKEMALDLTNHSRAALIPTFTNWPTLVAVEADRQRTAEHSCTHEIHPSAFYQIRARRTADV